MATAAIFNFPARTQHDGRPSTGARAASSAKRSAVKPADFDSEAARSGDHHSAGMLSRCHHLETAHALAPISAARASLEGHFSIIERNDARSDMDACIGQSVLECKAKVSYDGKFVIGHYAGMADRMSETEEELAFIRRVRDAREAKFQTQKPVYEFLGVRQDHYKHWETKRPMPRRFVPKFCTITSALALTRPPSETSRRLIPASYFMGQKAHVQTERPHG
jgi:hypothetical protein